MKLDSGKVDGAAYPAAGRTVRNNYCTGPTEGTTVNR
jgi:hypothetical protein